MTRGFSAGIAIAATAYLWIVAASNIYCAGIGRVDLFVFPFTQWLQIAPDWRANWWITLWVVVSAGIPTLAVLALLISFRWFWRSRRRLRRPLGGGLKPLEAGVSDNHGHAAWPSVADMLRRYGAPAPDHGAVVMGEARRVDQEPVASIPYDRNDKRTWGNGGKARLLFHDPKSGLSAAPHSFWCIGTGGGKTMQAAEVQYHWLGSIITFDPSCELGPMMKRWREKIGQRVVFVGKDSSQGQQGIAALDCIRPGTPDADSRILSMVASICGEETERKDKNSVFDSAGRNLIACLLAHLMYDKSTPDHLRTMKSLVDGITIPEDQMQATLRNIHSTSDSLQARRLAGIVMGTHKETFSGAYFSATQYAGWLLDPENAALLSGALKPSEILQGNLSIYIQIPTGSLLYVPGPGRVILDSIVSSVLQANGQYTDLMLLQADEAKLIGAMKSIEVVLTQGRKYGIVLNMIYTSINDMRRVWTEDGLETWLDNVEWAGFAAVGSKTAKWLSEELGKMAVLAYSEGSNSGTSGRILGSASRSKGSNISGHEIGRSLMNPDEFKDMRRDEAIIWFRTGRPIRCGLAPYYRRTPENIEIDTTSFRREEMLAAE